MAAAISLRRIAALALLCGAATFSLTPAARADALDTAKLAGMVGERPDGFVGLVRADAPPDVVQLVSEVNAGRLASYREIARKNDTSLDAVAVTAGRKLIQRTPPGQFVMDSHGRWKRK